MGTTLGTLKPNAGAVKKPKRIARGYGSGHGRTATRGIKGYGSRSGSGTKPGFEGGQMPIFRRLPKRGFKNPFRVEYQVVNIGQLERFDTEVTVEMLEKAGLTSHSAGPVKLLGNGDLSKPLKVSVDAASASAIEKVKAAGGEVTVPVVVERPAKMKFTKNSVTK
ncbi:MAG: 50S ribosomal protein L15 [bacterium]|nr:50S ribosomal protein L15 [bacterium]